MGRYHAGHGPFAPRQVLERALPLLLLLPLLPQARAVVQSPLLPLQAPLSVPVPWAAAEQLHGGVTGTAASGAISALDAVHILTSSRALLDSGAPSLSLDQGDLVPFAAQWPDLRRDQPAASGTSPQQQQQDTKGNSKAPLPSSTAGNVAFLAGQQPVDATATAAAATAGPFGLLPLPLPARLQQRRASTDGSASGQQAPSALPEAEDLAGELPFAAAAARSAANANSNSNTAVNPLVPGGWAVGGGVTGARAVVPWWRVIGGQAADTQRSGGGGALGGTQQQQQQSAPAEEESTAFRIIGGSAADADRYRFIASLRDQNGRHYCGGTHVMPGVVITAAHCVDQQDAALRNPTVHLGRYYLDRDDSSGHDVRKCATTIVHPGWSFNTGQHDLALCLLDSNSSKPMATVASGTLRVTLDTELQVVGFGAVKEGGTNNPSLLVGKIYPQDRSQCNKTYSGLIGNGMICAGRDVGGVDACQGDSGGPLLLPKGTPSSVFTAAASSSSSTSSSSASAASAPGLTEDVLLGVVSWGRGCGEPGNWGVYTYLPQYRDWVNQKLAEYGVPPLPVFAYPTAAQLQKLLSESYDCSSTPTVDQLEQAAAKLAEQGLEMQSAVNSVVAQYGCNPKNSSNTTTSSSSSSNNAKPPSSKAPSPSKQPCSGSKCKPPPPAATKPSKTSPPPSPAKGSPPPPPDPCRCSEDGRSGDVETPLKGCKQHGLAAGDTLWYCMAVGGPDACPSAVPSRVYLGSAWVPCSTSTTTSNNVGSASPANSSPPSPPSPAPPRVEASNGPSPSSSGGGSRRPTTTQQQQLSLGQIFTAWLENRGR